MVTGSRKPQKYQRDENEPEIVKALRAEGFIVTLLNDAGVPDLLVSWPSNKHPVQIVNNPADAIRYAYQKKFCLLEVKMPGESLTDTQRRWWNRNLNLRVK